MKKLFLALVALILSRPFIYADSLDRKEKVYGNITAIDHGQKILTVHNIREKIDTKFHFDEATSVKSNQKRIRAQQLTIGQSVYVAYMQENAWKKARLISVQAPFKRPTLK